MSIEGIQRRLANEGLYLGPIDSDWGPQTNLAHIKSLRKRGQIIPPWMLVAQGELGQRELPGPNDNPRIVKYHSYTSLGASDDETAWCSSYENFIMDAAGIEGTDSAMARSWLTWGDRLDPTQPRYGAVVIFPRGNSPVYGHVTNLVDWDDYTLYCLGGNQGNRVGVNAYNRSAALGFRWPTTIQLATLLTKLK